MSRMMLRSNGKPPVARSPIRLRPRRKALQPTDCNTIQTTPGPVIKSQMPTPKWAIEALDIRQTGPPVIKSQMPTPKRAVETHDIRPEYHTISCELRALAKMVHQELGPNDDTPMADCDGATIGPALFERGRFYDEYSARRNERLKKKKCEMEKKTSYDLGVRLDSAKKRESAGKLDGRRKSMVAAITTPVAERREAPALRYSLRSSAVAKENRKPPLPVSVPIMNSVERSVGVAERKVGVRRNMKAY